MTRASALILGTRTMNKRRRSPRFAGASDQLRRSAGSAGEAGRKKKAGRERPALHAVMRAAQVFWIATPELVTILTPLVSRRNSDPTIKVITATPIGYHRPA